MPRANIFECPVCGKESVHPTDIDFGYCPNCQGYTLERPPEGMQWVFFRGGSLSGRARLMETAKLEEGMTYEQMSTPEGEIWKYDGVEFVIERREAF